MSDFSQAFADEFLDGLVPGETVVDADVADVDVGLEPDETVIDADIADEAPHDHVADFARAMQESETSVEGINADQLLVSLEKIEQEQGRQLGSASPKDRVVLERPAANMKRRKWQIDSGQVFGPANGETDITLRPQCLFRCEKIMATDDSSNPGAGTRVLSVIIGTRVQKLTPGGNGTLTQFFAANALANGIKFDTNQNYETITIRVRFVQQCNFELSIFGTAVVDE